VQVFSAGDKVTAPHALFKTSMTTCYDFEALAITGKPVALKTIPGQTDADCQYRQRLRFHPAICRAWKNCTRPMAKKGLVVLGFPCNQFGAQDKGENSEIAEFCQLNYGVSFAMMAKIDVNGSEAHPLYQWLASEAPGLLGTKAIKWNFTKFLVGRDGQVIKRYAPTDTPQSMADDIEAVLAQT
jgi:glutathione peroxidase